jgi:putative tryptophan/tyrosine transport system substrate-binding protein
VQPVSRRRFAISAGALGFGLLVGCGRWPAQAERPPAKAARIGVLSPGVDSSRDIFQAFQARLRDLGYVEGQNITIEYRFAASRIELLPRLAEELVALPVDVLVVDGTSAGQAAKNATSAIPIVLGAVGNPVQSGLVTNFAQPGGNITGVSIGAGQIRAKGIELLHEAVPQVVRVAVIRNPQNRTPQWPEVQAAAQSLGLQLRSVEVQDPTDLPDALEEARRGDTDALVVLAAPEFIPYRGRITAFALSSQLPTLFFERDYVEAGGLMFYGVDIADRFGRAAHYVDRILKGAKPGDLPVEQPMVFDFVVNMKTARALGITFPPEILLQVTEVIE